jgi:hypothetical protein
VTRTTTDWTPQPPEPTDEPETPAGRVWARIVWTASWILPPSLLAGAYTVLALTSNTTLARKSWMAIGFAFALTLWLVFRNAVESAGLARALAVGDAERLLAIANCQLRRRRGDASRAPYLVYKALAHELQRQPTEALAAATEAKPVRDIHSLLALAVRISSLVDLGRTADARSLTTDLDALTSRVDRRLYPTPHHYAHLARARLFAAEGNAAAADAELANVIDDIRAGVALRERAQALRQLGRTQLPQPSASRRQ